jgi:hypothetical protein
LFSFFSLTFSLYFQTPNAHSLASSGYRDNSFYLLVPNPVEGGAYVCHVPPSEACLGSNSSADASLTLNKMESQLLIMEAKLEAKDAALDAKIAELKAQSMQSQAKEAALEMEISKSMSTQGKSKIDNLISHL